MVDSMMYYGYMESHLGSVKRPRNTEWWTVVYKIKDVRK